jgi:hypothetical protein
MVMLRTVRTVRRRLRRAFFHMILANFIAVSSGDLAVGQHCEWP